MSKQMTLNERLALYESVMQDQSLAEQLQKVEADTPGYATQKVQWVVDGARKKFALLDQAIHGKAHISHVAQEVHDELQSRLRFPHRRQELSDSYHKNVSLLEGLVRTRDAYKMSFTGAFKWFPVIKDLKELQRIEGLWHHVKESVFGPWAQGLYLGAGATAAAGLLMNDKQLLYGGLGLGIFLGLGRALAGYCYASDCYTPYLTIAKKAADQAKYLDNKIQELYK